MLLLSRKLLSPAFVLALTVVTAASTGCSSADEPHGDGSSSSDLSTAEDACQTARILCPNNAHCEALDGHPACVADSKVGFFPADAGASPDGSKVGFFPPCDGGGGASDGGSKVGFFGH